MTPAMHHPRMREASASLREKLAMPGPVARSYETLPVGRLGNLLGGTFALAAVLLLIIIFASLGEYQG